MSIINENIRKFREMRRMNQKQLAEKLHKSRAVISNWERGENAPDPDTVEQICKIFNVTPNMIFGWEKCPEYEKYKERIKEYTSRYAQLATEKMRIEEELNKLQKELAIDYFVDGD